MALKIKRDDLPYKVVNTKPKPPWPHTMQSYPIDVEVTHVKDTWVGYGNSTYKAKVRYERYDGDVVCEFHLFDQLHHAVSSARDVIAEYRPGSKTIKKPRREGPPLEQRLADILEVYRAECSR